MDPTRRLVYTFYPHPLSTTTSTHSIMDKNEELHYPPLQSSQIVVDTGRCTVMIEYTCSSRLLDEQKQLSSAATVFQCASHSRSSNRGRWCIGHDSWGRSCCSCGSGWWWSGVAYESVADRQIDDKGEDDNDTEDKRFGPYIFIPHLAPNSSSIVLEALRLRKSRIFRLNAWQRRARYTEPCDDHVLNQWQLFQKPDHFLLDWDQICWICRQQECGLATHLIP